MRTVIIGATYQLGDECLRAERWPDPVEGDWLLLADCGSRALRHRVLPSGLLLRLIRRSDGWYD